MRSEKSNPPPISTSRGNIRVLVLPDRLSRLPFQNAQKIHCVDKALTSKRRQGLAVRSFPRFAQIGRGFVGTTRRNRIRYWNQIFTASPWQLTGSRPAIFRRLPCIVLRRIFCQPMFFLQRRSEQSGTSAPRVRSSNHVFLAAFRAARTGGICSFDWRSTASDAGEIRIGNGHFGVRALRT